MSDEVAKLNMQLTVEEINTILQALQELPAKICNPLTNKILEQCNPQLESIKILNTAT